MSAVPAVDKGERRLAADVSRVYRHLKQEKLGHTASRTFDHSDAPQTVEVAPKATVTRDIVAAWDIDPRVHDRASELADRNVHKRAFANPPALCSRVPNGAVTTRAGVVLTDDGRWIVESVGAPIVEAIELERWRRIRIEPPQRVVDEDVAVIYSLISEKKHANYYHWVVEGLSRAAMLGQAGVPESVRVLVPEPVLELHRQTLAAIGIDESRIFAWSGVPTRFRTVYLPSGPQHRGDRPLAASVSYLRQHAERFRTEQPTRRLWVSRRQARRRRKHLAGEDELLAVALGFGFEEVVAETLTATEQLQLFAQAEAIAGVHGAGLANAVFMAPDTAVVEAAPESLKARQKPLFWNLAAAGRQTYAYCVGPTEGLEPRRFERVLGETLG